MSYSLYSEDGVQGQLSTIQGMEDLVQFVDQHPMFSALAELVTNGETTNVEQLKEDCMSALAVAPLDVGSTLRNLYGLLGKVKEVAIVSQ